MKNMFEHTPSRRTGDYVGLGFGEGCGLGFGQSDCRYSALGSHESTRPGQAAPQTNSQAKQPGHDDRNEAAEVPPREPIVAKVSNDRLVGVAVAGVEGHVAGLDADADRGDEGDNGNDQEEDEAGELERVASFSPTDAEESCSYTGGVVRIKAGTSAGIISYCCPGYFYLLHH